jgi:uncharacterized protein (DUF1501 family)
MKYLMRPLKMRLCSRHNFPTTTLSLDLQMVANTLAARDTLGAKRQIFFVQLGGFDNHDELLNRHAGLMNILDTALSEFDSALGELGLRDCVTTFTISDFARTLTSNGNGTDHGWGGNAIVMGGAVKGKDMYGMYPDLALNSSLELGEECSYLLPVPIAILRNWPYGLVYHPMTFP